MPYASQRGSSIARNVPVQQPNRLMVEDQEMPLPSYAQAA